jgi:hypothetical protein
MISPNLSYYGLKRQLSKKVPEFNIEDKIIHYVLKSSNFRWICPPISLDLSHLGICTFILKLLKATKREAAAFF